MSSFQAPFSPPSHTWSWHTASGKKTPIYHIRSGPRKFSLWSRGTLALNPMSDFHLRLLDSVWDQSTFSLTRHCGLTEREWMKWASERERERQWQRQKEREREWVGGGVHTGMCVCVHTCMCVSACLCSLGKLLKITHFVYQFTVIFCSDMKFLPAGLFAVNVLSLPPSFKPLAQVQPGRVYLGVTVYQLLFITQQLYLHHNTQHRTPLSPLALAANTHTHSKRERDSKDQM